MGRIKQRPGVEVIVTTSPFISLLPNWMQCDQGPPAMIDSAFELRTNTNPLLLSCFCWLFCHSDEQK
ncbi:hypothetical protein ACRRTK_019902 [Alexandromys fortis]